MNKLINIVKTERSIKDEERIEIEFSLLQEMFFNHLKRTRSRLMPCVPAPENLLYCIYLTLSLWDTKFHTGLFFYLKQHQP